MISEINFVKHIKYREIDSQHLNNVGKNSSQLQDCATVAPSQWPAHLTRPGRGQGYVIRVSSAAVSAVTGECDERIACTYSARARSPATGQAGHRAAQCGPRTQTVIIIISVINIIIISDFC